MASGRTDELHANSLQGYLCGTPELGNFPQDRGFPADDTLRLPPSAGTTLPHAIEASARSRAGAPIDCFNPFTPLLRADQLEVETTNSPSASCPTLGKPDHDPAHVESHIASWNIGGTSIQDAVQSTRLAAGPKIGILCLQEVPRHPTGWKTTEVDGMTVVQYRHDDEQWRGNAIAFSSEYQVLRRRGSRFGIWLRLRHLPTENEMWISSIR